MRYLLFPLLIVSLGASSCAQAGSAPPDYRPHPADQSTLCESELGCTLSGSFEMSSDGHAFIGILHLDDGKCLNVSLPDDVSAALLGKPAARKTVVGDLYRYPADQSVDEFRINKRKIGFGLCGDRVLFVK